MEYQRMLRDGLRGRKLRPDAMPEAHADRPMWSFWGSELGFAEGDIHAEQAYRVYVDADQNGIIRDVWIVIEGDLLSPCSGFSYEEPDQFDIGPLLRWCLGHTDEP